MGKKDRTFASKVAKAALDFSVKCPVCGEGFHLLKVVSTIKSPKKNSYRFQEKMVRVCKCNEKQIYAA